MAAGPTIDIYVTVLAGLVRVRASLAYHDWFDQTTALADVLGALAGDRDLTRVAARPAPRSQADELAFPLPPQRGWRTPRTWPEHVIDDAIADTRAIVDASRSEIYEQAGDLASSDDPDTVAAVDGAVTDRLADQLQTMAAAMPTKEGLLVVPATVVFTAMLLELGDRGWQTSDCGRWQALTIDGVDLYAVTTGPAGYFPFDRDHGGGMRKLRMAAAAFRPTGALSIGAQRQGGLPPAERP